MAEENDKNEGMAHEKEVAAAVALAVQVTKRDFQLAEIEKRILRLEDELERTKEILASIDTAANRWKGGFLVIVALGAVIGWLISVSSGLRSVFK